MSSIYAQRINSTGAIQWTINGISLADSSGNQESQEMIKDSAGNVIIVWQDYNSSKDTDLYAQKIDKNGNIQWGQNGVLVCGDTGDQIHPRLSPDGNDGAIITWEVYRNYYDVYAQRIDGNGTIQWSNTGVAISTEETSQWGPEMAILSDRSGAIIVWTDFRNDKTVSGRDIYAQFVSMGGNILK